jgi:hypothetical protein
LATVDLRPLTGPRKRNAEKSAFCLDASADVQKNLHMSRKLHLLVAAALAVLLLPQCTSSVRSDFAPSAPLSGAEATSRASAYAPPSERPGLGTQLGHEIHRDLPDATRFYRRSASSPDAVATFHYNDAEGAKLMAEMSGNVVKRRGAFELIPGKLKVTVAPNYYGTSDYDYYLAGGKIFVVGVPGQDYELKLENLTRTRMEVVVSIDGLDVLDGQPASVRKRGYVIAPKSSILIEGMRVGGKLKTMRFGTVDRSRAATAFGQSGARNVGVIGIASYEEDEAARRRANLAEVYVREGAKPFR